MIVIYRALSVVPVPLAEPAQLRQLLDNVFNEGQLLGFINLLSGGALANFSIVLMGLGPYINASIIMQLLGKAVPKLEEIQKDGESGRRRINQYTRILALPLALFQSIGILLILRQQASSTAGIDFTANTSIFQWALMVAALVGGSMLLMWLGELMTEQGVGNGISILIFAGIVSQLPSIVNSLAQSLSLAIGEQYSIFEWFTVPVNVPTLLIITTILLLTLAVTYWVVKLNEAQRIVTVSYAKRVRGNRAYGGVDTVLPVKLILAGVIPIIFAVAFLSVPVFVGQLLINANSAWASDLGQRMIEWFQVTGLSGDSNLAAGSSTAYIYPSVYFLLVVAFTYFYTGIAFNAKEISENLQKQGGFIGGIRPGKQTEEYLKRIVNRLTLFGSISLGLLAVMPVVLQLLAYNVFGINLGQLTIGGTSLMIAVSVSIETLRQIESRALMVTYDQSPE